MELMSVYLISITNGCTVIQCARRSFTSVSLRWNRYGSLVNVHGVVIDRQTRSSDHYRWCDFCLHFHESSTESALHCASFPPDLNHTLRMRDRSGHWAGGIGETVMLEIGQVGRCVRQTLISWVLILSLRLHLVCAAVRSTQSRFTSTVTEVLRQLAVGCCQEQCASSTSF